MSYRALYRFVTVPEHPGDYKKFRMELAPLVRSISQYHLTDIFVEEALEKCYELDMKNATSAIRRECVEYKYQYLRKYLDEAYNDILIHAINEA